MEDQSFWISKSIFLSEFEFTIIQLRVVLTSQVFKLWNFKVIKALLQIILYYVTQLRQKSALCIKNRKVFYIYMHCNELIYDIQAVIRLSLRFICITIIKVVNCGFSIIIIV